ncbi:hypothetical protein [Desulfocicer niacini]
MKFERIVEDLAHDTTLEDSQDNLDCFGEFCKTDEVCTRYCSASIQCALEHTHNPGIDIFEELLILNYFPVRMQ